MYNNCNKFKYKKLVPSKRLILFWDMVQNYFLKNSLNINRLATHPMDVTTIN